MSRAFEGLGFVAAVVFVIIVISRGIQSGARGISHFIENSYLIIGILLTAIIIGVCFIIFNSSDSRQLSVGIRVFNTAACGLALAQNACFLVYGFYRAITVQPDSAFLTVLGVGGFILFYIIDLFLTIGAILLSINKSWGSIITIAQFALGVLLIVSW